MNNNMKKQNNLIYLIYASLILSTIIFMLSNFIYVTSSDFYGSNISNVFTINILSYLLIISIPVSAILNEKMKASILILIYGATIFLLMLAFPITALFVIPFIFNFSIIGNGNIEIDAEKTFCRKKRTLIILSIISSVTIFSYFIITSKNIYFVNNSFLSVYYIFGVSIFLLSVIMPVLYSFKQINSIILPFAISSIIIAEIFSITFILPSSYSAMDYIYWIFLIPFIINSFIINLPNIKRYESNNNLMES